MAPNTEHPPAERMHCMEVWGGNQTADSFFSVPGLDVRVFCRPHDGAPSGGDLYYVSSCASGRITRMLVADVAGHGTLVSEIATRLRNLMRRYINYIRQTRFVDEVNRAFTSDSRESSFATAVIGTFFAPTRSLSICNAGHPAPLVYRAASRRWTLLDDEADEAASANFPLGVADETRYRQFDTSLAVGDLVLCYTDSLIETPAANGSLLGTAGLEALVEDVAVDDLQTFVERLLDRVADRSPQAASGDDLTVMLFRANGSGTTLADNLAAPFRLLREWLSRWSRTDANSAAIDPVEAST